MMRDLPPAFREHLAEERRLERELVKATRERLARRDDV